MEKEMSDKHTPAAKAHGGGGAGAGGGGGVDVDGVEGERKGGEDGVEVEEDVIGSWTEDEEDVVEGAFTPASSRRSTGSESRRSSDMGQALSSSSAISNGTSASSEAVNGEHQQPDMNDSVDVPAIT